MLFVFIYPFLIILLRICLYLHSYLRLCTFLNLFSYPFRDLFFFQFYPSFTPVLTKIMQNSFFCIIFSKLLHLTSLQLKKMRIKCEDFPVHTNFCVFISNCELLDWQQENVNMLHAEGKVHLPSVHLIKIE